MNNTKVTTVNTLKAEVNKIYNKLPEISGCEKACKNKKCDFECCTITGCAPVEMILINSYIERNKLNLPKITEKTLWGYLLPNKDNINNLKEYPDTTEKLEAAMKLAETTKCSYLSEERGCLIYEQRPLICRLFGTTNEMNCEHTKCERLIPLEEVNNKYLSPLIELVPSNANIKVI